MEKACKKCGVVKALDEFHRAAGTRDGHRGECKRCHADAKRLWYQANKEAVKAKVKRWQQENAERHNDSQRRRRQDPLRRRKERDGHLRRKFGMTVEQYELLLVTQGGVCAICRRPPNPNISLHVDHDHESGRIRRLTCFRCNQALGAFGEDAALLRRAADYLDRHAIADRRSEDVIDSRWQIFPTRASDLWKRSASPPLASGSHEDPALRPR